MSELVLEGTWEEIVGHAAELAGKKVRLTVLAEDTKQAEVEEHSATVAALREGIESFRRGEGRPAREALEELRQNMAYRVEISLPALADAEDAYLWIKYHAPEAAGEWYEGLLAAIFSLENFLLRCARAPESADLSTEVRQLLYGKTQSTIPHSVWP